MGFSAVPPRNDTALVVPAINMWAQRADAAIIHASPLPSRTSCDPNISDSWPKRISSERRSASRAIRISVASPEDLPPEYYSRVVQGTALPVLVVEGGWPSIRVGSVVSTPAAQARYIGRQVELLSTTTARGLFQLTFYDIDLTGVTLPAGSILPLFTHLGLADSAMHAKPALTNWDAVFRRPYRP